MIDHKGIQVAMFRLMAEAWDDMVLPGQGEYPTVFTALQAVDLNVLEKMESFRARTGVYPAFGVVQIGAFRAHPKIMSAYVFSAAFGRIEGFSPDNRPATQEGIARRLDDLRLVIEKGGWGYDEPGVLDHSDSNPVNGVLMDQKPGLLGGLLMYSSLTYYDPTEWPG